MEVIDNVISAYEAVKMNGVSQGIIALCSFIAVIIVIQKFVTAWKEAFSEGDKPVDMKQFFKLFYIYIYVFAIIMVAPFAFTIVETALGNLQNELISHYQEDVDLSIDEAIVTFTKDYIEDVQRRHNWVGQQIQEVIMLPFNIAAYTILLYATKYIFFFFASARYLYLILLEIACKIRQSGAYLLGSASEYKTIYVPFGDTWEQGKRHIYTLIFGGGYDDQGEAVLNPIQFDAETTGWVDADKDVNVQP